MKRRVYSTHNPQEVFEFVVDWKRKNSGVGPTVREIADGVGYASAGNALLALRKLEKAGMIRLLGEGRPGIEVVGSKWIYEGKAIYEA